MKLKTLSKITFIITLALSILFAKAINAETLVELELKAEQESTTINEEVPVYLTTNSGSLDNINAFSFSIVVPKDMVIENLNNEIDTDFYIEHLKSTYNETLDANRIEFLVGKEPEATFSLNPGTRLLSFTVKAPQSGMYNIEFQSDFNNSVLDVEGNEVINLLTLSNTESIKVADDLVVNDLYVSTNENYQVSTQALNVGETQYIDRDYTFEQIPPELEGATIIKTANNDKTVRENIHVKFNTNQDVSVYIAHDDRYNVKPVWLNNWTDTEQEILTTDQHNPNFSLYSKDFEKGEVILGGNVSPQEIENNSMYTILIQGQEGTSEPINKAPVTEAGNNKVVNLGDTLQLNGSVTDDGLPSYTELLTTNWIDVNSTGSINFSDQSSLTTNVTFNNAGEYVLQLTAHDGELSSSDSVKVVVVDPETLEINITNIDSQNDYVVAKNSLVLGAKQYTDRNYIFSNIPEYLEKSTFIRTSNNDKKSTTDNFISFNVNQPVTVYIAHDKRLTTKPTWLNDWESTGDNINVPIAGSFEVFSKEFETGDIVLGGNSNPTQVQGSSSMYSVIVVPTR